MSLEDTILIGAFFMIAILYSSIGFGGGSSYLALLSLFWIDFFDIRTTALLCNITVVSSSIYLYYKNGFLNLKKAFPLVILSIPAAFLGACMPLSQHSFFILLGIVLIITSILLLIQTIRASKQHLHDFHSKKSIGITIGAAIGFLSGMVGIGGGIFLSPTLQLLQWDRVKNIVALAAFFILVNSLSGIIGLWWSHHLSVLSPLSFYLLGAVFLGGQIGVRLSLRKLSPDIIKILTAILVAYVGCKLVFG